MLVIGNRDERHVREDGMDEPLLFSIQTPVHRRHRAIEKIANDRVVQHVDMKVEDVELIGASPDAIE